VKVRDVKEEDVKGKCEGEIYILFHFLVEKSCILSASDGLPVVDGKLKEKWLFDHEVKGLSW
jgi:hypothetical protein